MCLEGQGVPNLSRGNEWGNWLAVGQLTLSCVDDT